MDTTKIPLFLEDQNTQFSVDSIVGDLKKHIDGLQLMATESQFYQDEYKKLNELHSQIKTEYSDLKKDWDRKTKEVTLLKSDLCSIEAKAESLRNELEKEKVTTDRTQVEFGLLKQELAERDEEVLTLQTQLKAIEESLKEDVESWKAKALELISNLQSKEEESKREMNRLNGLIDELHRRQAQLQIENEQFEISVGKLFVSNSGQSLEIESLSGKIAEVLAEKAQLQADLDGAAKENGRLIVDLYKTKSQVDKLQEKKESLLTLRKEVKSFYKTVIRSLKGEIADLKARNEFIEQQLTAQIELNQRNQAEALERLSMEINSSHVKLKKQEISFENELSQTINEMEAIFAQELTNLKLSHENKIKSLSHQYEEAALEQRQLLDSRAAEIKSINLDFEHKLNSALVRFDEDRKKLNREILDLKSSYEKRLSAQNLNFIEIQKENESLKIKFQSDLNLIQGELTAEKILRQNLQAEVVKKTEDFEDIKSKYSSVHTKYENDFFEYAQVNAELRHINIEKLEEIKSLKAQLHEKSRQLVRLEVALHESTLAAKSAGGADLPASDF